MEKRASGGREGGGGSAALREVENGHDQMSRLSLSVAWHIAVAFLSTSTRAHECDAARWLMRLPMDACLIALIKIHAARRGIGLAGREGDRAMGWVVEDGERGREEGGGDA